jgi:DNA helicase-2/ATP-dependent DNA helicase PcrA
LDAAKACIDRYFELELSDWDVIDTEREFELEIEGHELIGFIDAVYRTPQDELIVIDYKATTRHRNIEEDQQLPIYLLACQDLYEEPVSRAGYAYVGEIGPKVEMRAVDENELDTVRSTVLTTMNRISETSFERYDAGDHCRWCRHKGLPCAAERTGGFEES